MTPLNRLRRYPMVQPAAPMVATNPAPTGLQMQWMPGIGGEDEGDTQGYSDLSKALGGYLKKRQAQAMQNRMGDAPMGTPGNVA